MMTWTVPCLTETIILWMISILFGYLIFSVVRSFLTPRWKHPVSTAFSVLLLFSSANIVVYPEELTGTVGFFFCFILIIFLLFKNEWYLKLSAAILIFPVVVSINYITQDIGHLIWVYAFDRTFFHRADSFTYDNVSPSPPYLVSSVPVGEALALLYCKTFTSPHVDRA